MSGCISKKTQIQSPSPFPNAQSVSNAATAAVSSPVLGYTELHVSPMAASNGTGSLSQPFNSLSEAQTKWRQLRRQNQNVTIFLHDGYFALTAPLILTAADNGTPTAPILFKAYPGDHPVIGSRTVITGWSSSPGRPGILEATVKAPLYVRHLDNLTYPFVKMRNAQYPPDEGTYIRALDYVMINGHKSTQLCGPDYHPMYGGPDATIGHVLVDQNLPEPVLNATGQVELRIIKNFSLSILPVAFERQNPSALLVRSGGDLEGKNSCNVRNFPYRAVLANSPDFIRYAGRWAFVSSPDGTGKVYYKPLSGENTANLRLAYSKLSNLVTIAGRADKQFANVRFEGIRFEDTDWGVPAGDGYVGGQGTVSNPYLCRQGFDCIVPSAVRIENANHVSIDAGSFLNMGTSAIQIGENTQDISITRNHFREIAGNAITVATFADVLGTDNSNPIHDSANLEIENNLIERIGSDYGGEGILAANVKNARISGNLLQEIAYSGISMGWFSMLGVGVSNNLIQQNEITNAMTTFHDGGAIYIMAGSGALQATRNYIHDMYGEPAVPGVETLTNPAIYLDYGTWDTRVFYNQLSHIKEAFFLQFDDSVPAASNLIHSIYLNDVDRVWATPDPRILNKVFTNGNQVYYLSGDKSADLAAGLPVPLATGLFASALRMPDMGLFRTPSNAVFYSYGSGFCSYPFWTKSLRGIPIKAAPPQTSELYYAGACP